MGDEIFQKPENRLTPAELADPKKNMEHHHWHDRNYGPRRLEPPKPISRALERSIGVYLWNRHIVKWEFGLMPREYDFKKHGPFVPYRNYALSLCTPNSRI